MPLEDGIGVQLLEVRSPVLDRLPADRLQALEQLFGGRPAVALDESDGHVLALTTTPVALGEHGDGLAHPGGRTQVDGEPAYAYVHAYAGVGHRTGTSRTGVTHRVGWFPAGAHLRTDGSGRTARSSAAGAPHHPPA